MILTKDIIEKSGFELIENNHLKDYMASCGINEFAQYRRATPDGNIIINIDNGFTNLRTWNIHLDNISYETIGLIEIDTVEQFNKIMEIYDNDFRL